MALTSTQQRNAASEGMALGLLMCGRAEIKYDKVPVDLAFASAWRGWQYASRFKQVSTDLAPSLAGLRIMTRATNSKKTFNLYWDTGGGVLAIYSRPQWHHEDLDAEMIAGSIDGDVPAEGWRMLAAAFLERLEPPTNAH